MKKIISKILNYIAKFYKVKNNKILFQSGRSRVDGNPYAIYKYIKENCSNDFECIWIVDKDTDVSMLDKNDYCFYKTYKAFVSMVTSKYWLRSQSLGSIIKKKDNQIYIQLWHGAGALKKCGYDCEDNSNDDNPTMEHAKEWDYLIGTDEYNRKALVSSMGFKKESIAIGNIETDYLINKNKDQIQMIKDKIGLDDKKVIMYAPTFRDEELNYDEINIPIFKLKDLADYKILLRLHPLVSKKMSNIVLPENFINVGWYPNILDLYLVTDILITDYSSIIFPYMLLGKSIIMYPYDYDAYVKNRSGFYLDYKKDLPGPIVYNEEELIDTIRNIDNINKKYKSKVKVFNKKYNILNDGQVCKRFVEKLKNKEFK